MQHTNEEWREVPGYPGYRVSSFGRCSGPRKAILKASPRRGGYPQVGLYKSGKKKCIRVHVLVALVFLGPKPEGFECCHLDGDKQNNWWTNLNYVTHSENESHKRLHGTHIEGERHGGAKLTEDNVKYILENYRWRDVGFGCAALGRKFNVANSGISRIVHGRIWKHIPRPLKLIG